MVSKGGRGPLALGFITHHPSPITHRPSSVLLSRIHPPAPTLTQNSPHHRGMLSSSGQKHGSGCLVGRAGSRDGSQPCRCFGGWPRRVDMLLRQASVRSSVSKDRHSCVCLCMRGYGWVRVWVWV